MTRKPSPKAIQHDTRLLRGPPDSVRMRSGLVILEPGKSVGMHTTLNNEELIIVLEGEGVAHIAGRDPIKFDKKNAMYIPPQTEHNITSTGSKALRYIYVVSNAE